MLGGRGELGPSRRGTPCWRGGGGARGYLLPGLNPFLPPGPPSHPGSQLKRQLQGTLKNALCCFCLAHFNLPHNYGHIIMHLIKYLKYPTCIPKGAVRLRELRGKDPRAHDFPDHFQVIAISAVLLGHNYTLNSENGRSGLPCEDQKLGLHLKF